MRTPNYKVIESNEDRVVLQDLGPWDEYPTITNAVEAVLQQIAGMLLVKPHNGPNIYYIDSEGECTRILWEGGPQALVENQPRFKGFLGVAFYLQDKRSIIGNTLLWWAEGGRGYTTDLDKAQRWSLRELKERGYDDPDHPKYRMWFADYIDERTSRTVDCQKVETFLSKYITANEDINP